ncbi:MAG TPA: hypothetical protein VGL94_20295 [Ktedonobacteraceae bacterium]|jgi:hypothetical protein
MEKVSLGKIRTSMVTNGAGLFILAILAIAFFAFPSVAFGLVGTGWSPSENVDTSHSLNTIAPPSVTVKLFAAYKIQNDGVSPSNTGKFWPDALTSFHNASPIGVTIATSVPVAQIPAGAIVQVDVPNAPPPQGTSSDPLTPHRNALCIGKDPVTHKNQVLVVVNGQLEKAFLGN